MDFGPDMPVPTIDQDTEAFWAASREHRLVVQRCGACGAHRFAPAPICHACQSFETVLDESAGRGALYTWTVVHQVLHPAVEMAVPYNVAIVRLDDCGGAMITTNIVGVANDELVAGMPVVVAWDDVSDGWSLPRFTPVRSEVLAIARQGGLGMPITSASDVSTTGAVARSSARMPHTGPR